MKCIHIELDIGIQIDIGKHGIYIDIAYPFVLATTEIVGFETAGSGEGCGDTMNESSDESEQ